MLYERWRKISAERRDELALRDFASGRDAGRLWNCSSPAKNQKIGLRLSATVCPQGAFAGIHFGAPIAAWRENRVVRPLETGQGGANIPASRASSMALPHPLPTFKFTSATSGAARFVAFTAQQLMTDAENIIATMGACAARDWPNLGVISLAHSYGFSNLVLPLLLHGIPLILAPAPLPEIIHRAAEKEKSITLPAVPAMWRAWHEAAVIPQNVRLAISAGAPLPVNLEREMFKVSGVKIHNFLGSSECGGIAYDASETPRTDDALVGSPMQTVQLSLSKDGCLVVHSDAVAETYWPEKSESLGGGIFQTSDLAELKNGLVYLRGRLDDQINVAGRKVSPEAVERALLTHPQMRGYAFVLSARWPVTCERTEIIVAIVASGAPESELKSFLLQTLPAWQVPREWHFVDSLPTNARGKISRSEWRNQFMA